jgi:hypothetical protein
LTALAQSNINMVTVAPSPAKLIRHNSASPIQRFASPLQESPIPSAPKNDTLGAPAAYTRNLIPSLSLPAIPLGFGLPATLPMSYFDPNTGQVMVVDYSPTTPRTAVQMQAPEIEAILAQVGVDPSQFSDPSAFLGVQQRNFRPSFSEADLGTMTPGLLELPQKQRTLIGQGQMRPSVSVPSDLGGLNPVTFSRPSVPGTEPTMGYAFQNEDKFEALDEGDEYFHVEQEESGFAEQ